MCLECGKKAVEIDGRVPHFIDRYEGNVHGNSLSDNDYYHGLAELDTFMQEKHEKVIQLNEC